jgi:predicted regulator of Ras-like GTPase activity (Roadblock/LC7/MglB family)
LINFQFFSIIRIEGNVPANDMVMFEEEFLQITQVLKQLLVDTEAKVVFLIDKKGQLIAAEGEIENLDTTSIASLTAGNIAATGGLPRLLGEKEFSILFEDGERDNLHISIIGDQLILVVIFDKRSDLNIVGSKVKDINDKLEKIFKNLRKKDGGNWPGSGEGGASGPGGDTAEMTLSIFDTGPPKESMK